MPFVNITVRRPRTRAFKDTVPGGREYASFAGGRQIHV